MTQTLAASSGSRAGTADRDVILRLDRLAKRYGQRLAVNSLSLDVRRGEIFGFLGPNGAGKTTTIRMALGLIAPTAGSARILGHDVATDGARILPHVGALVEQPALYGYMSGRDNLRAVAAVLGGVSETRLDTVLELVGLRGRDGDRVRTYSLGMKQRLGVAMALLQDPDLLILDEPANGLDPAGIVEMRDLLRQLVAQGKTIFLSSHVLTEVRQLCTRVAIINLGQLVTESTVEDLLRGHGEFAVSVEQSPAALALIQAQPWGRAARLDGPSTIITPAPNGRGRDLNLFLVQAGYAPEAIAPHAQDLEHVFLALTGATNGTH